MGEVRLTGDEIRETGVLAGEKAREKREMGSFVIYLKDKNPKYYFMNCINRLRDFRTNKQTKYRAWAEKQTSFRLGTSQLSG